MKKFAILTVMAGGAANGFPRKASLEKKAGSLSAFRQPTEARLMIPVFSSLKMALKSGLI